jgi:hypothetical protein
MFIKTTVILVGIVIAVPLFSMVPINNWKELKPFAGRFVAYKTNSYNFGAQNGFSLNTDLALKYGYLSHLVWEWEKGEEVYHLQMVLKPHEISSKRLIFNSTLGDLSMRFCSCEEIILIKDAINNNQAKFEH